MEERSPLNMRWDAGFPGSGIQMQFMWMRERYGKRNVFSDAMEQEMIGDLAVCSGQPQ